MPKVECIENEISDLWDILNICIFGQILIYFSDENLSISFLLTSYPDLILWLKREETKMQDWLHFQSRICSELSFCRIQGVGVTHMHLPCVRVQGVGVTRFQMR